MLTVGSIITMALAGFSSDITSLSAEARIRRISAQFILGHPIANQDVRYVKLTYTYPPPPSWAGNWRHYRITNTAGYGLEVYTHYIYFANTKAEASIVTRDLSDYVSTSALNPSGKPGEGGLIYLRKSGLWSWPGGSIDIVQAYAYVEGFPNRAGATSLISAEKAGPYTNWVKFSYKLEGTVSLSQLIHPPRLNYPSGLSQPKPGVVELWDGSYLISAEYAVPFKEPAAGGFSNRPTRPVIGKRSYVVFDRWEAKGEILVSDPYSPSTSVEVKGDGILTAIYKPRWWNVSWPQVNFSSILNLFDSAIPVYTPGGSETDVLSLNKLKALILPHRSSYG